MTLLTTSILIEKMLGQLLSHKKQKSSRRSKFSLRICVHDWSGIQMWPLNTWGDDGHTFLLVIVR